LAYGTVAVRYGRVVCLKLSSTRANSTTGLLTVILYTLYFYICMSVSVIHPFGRNIIKVELN